MSSVDEKIAQYIAENLLYSKHGFPYPHSASFIENGIIDSMNILELVMFVEEGFGVDVTDEDIVPENFDSVTRVADFIRRKQQ